MICSVMRDSWFLLSKCTVYKGRVGENEKITLAMYLNVSDWYECEFFRPLYMPLENIPSLAVDNLVHYFA